MTSTDDLVRKAQAARDALQGFYFSAEEGSPLEAGALAGAEAITGLLERVPLTPTSGDLEKLSGAATPGRFMVEVSPDGDALWVGSARGDGVKLRHIVYGVNGLLGYRAEYADRVRADADYIAALINAHRSGQNLGPMTADEILGVARKAAARAFIENGHEEIAERVLAGQHDDYGNVKCSIDAINILLAEQSSTPDGVIKERGEDDADLNARLKAAGMYSIPEMMGVTPLTRWTVQAGMTNLDAFTAWLDRRVGQFLRMKASYELGDKDKGDELYEWVNAHSAALSEVRENFRAAREAMAVAPASTVQPPSSQESGVGENEGETHTEALERVLRDVASYLGVGGYNAPAVDPDTFYRKIIDGIALTTDPLAKDAARYRKLRTVGAAPGGTLHLEEGLVFVASNLDAWLDYCLENGRPPAPSHAIEFPSQEGA